MAKILLLSSIYPADDVPNSCTPVAHYFAKEWRAAGNDVIAIHNISVFPNFYYKLAKLLGADTLSSVFGFTIVPKKLEDKSYVLDGVNVYRLGMQKSLPHGKFPKSALEKQIEKIADICEKNSFCPDAIIGHWLNPQLELLQGLKKIFPKAKTALTLHDKFKTLEKFYPGSWREKINNIDKIGFRNRFHLKQFAAESGLKAGKAYLCLSGIPEYFTAQTPQKTFEGGLKNFVFIGTLFKRKYPELLIPVIAEAFKGADFSISYAGEGAQYKEIQKKAAQFAVQDKVRMLGKIPRAEMNGLLDRGDCLIMISDNEIYGLVYLEAMAKGCIVVASKNNGFDGIIKDGVNGFLCSPCDADELTS
ncbi:MAG: glycosyltransferase, partial [Opitutales bacterium]|nr:glycosyltransferase [Opitutales bacterium]